MGLNSKVFTASLRSKGRKFDTSNNCPSFSFDIYRYSGEHSRSPGVDSYKIAMKECGAMVLDALMHIKDNIDPTLSFRRSCREGVCGSCAVNINGRNALACTSAISDYGSNVAVFPLPHLPVIRDLVTDMTVFYDQYGKIKPWLQQSVDRAAAKGERENLQSVEDRAKLDGSYECILCACCSTACPSYWWAGAEKGKSEYIGPAALLHANRWIMDSRDDATEERLEEFEENLKVYKCYTIMNCVDACPKGLNPAKSIANIKKLLASRKIRSGA